MNDPLVMIRARRAEIAKLRKQLDAEEADLSQAERTIVRLTTKGPQAGNGSDKEPATQREYVIATLRESNTEWFENVAALREEIKRVHNKDIKATTFQPLVSMMTAEGILRRDGQRIGLAARVGR